MKTITDRRIKEVVGDYSMAGTRRAEAPGNIRVGYQITGGRDFIEDDAASEKQDELQDESALPQAAVVYATKDGKVLAVSRGSNTSDLNLPGGGVNPGEDPKDAAGRELWEETGLRAGKLVQIFKKIQGGKLVTVYRGAHLKGKLSSSSEGSASWEDPEALFQGRYGDFFREILHKCYGGDVNESRVALRRDLNGGLKLLWKIYGRKL